MLPFPLHQSVLQEFEDYMQPIAFFANLLHPLFKPSRGFFLSKYQNSAERKKQRGRTPRLTSDFTYLHLQNYRKPFHTVIVEKCTCCVLTSSPIKFPFHCSDIFLVIHYRSLLRRIITPNDSSGRNSCALCEHGVVVSFLPSGIF